MGFTISLALRKQEKKLEKKYLGQGKYENFEQKKLFSQNMDIKPIINYLIFYCQTYYTKLNFQIKNIILRKT